MRGCSEPRATASFSSTPAAATIAGNGIENTAIASNAPAASPRDARAFVLGEAGYVTCFEAFPEGFLIATNLFVREEGEWRLVHHQAGPTRDQPAEEDENDPTRPRAMQ